MGKIGRAYLEMGSALICFLAGDIATISLQLEQGEDFCIGTRHRLRPMQGSDFAIKQSPRLMSPSHALIVVGDGPTSVSWPSSAYRVRIRRAGLSGDRQNLAWTLRNDIL